MDAVCGGKSSKVNLTVLRQNTKAKKDKMSGRKKPRIGDCEPAPDSAPMTTTITLGPECNAEDSFAHVQGSKS